MPEAYQAAICRFLNGALILQAEVTATLGGADKG